MMLTRWPVLTAVMALILSAGRLSAGDIYDKGPAATDQIVLPTPAEVQSVASTPTKITLKGIDDAAQIVVTANLTGGKLQDLSSAVKYEIADAKVARVTDSGRVLPLANGTTEITARYGDKAVKIP